MQPFVTDTHTLTHFGETLSALKAQQTVTDGTERRRKEENTAFPSDSRDALIGDEKETDNK